MKTTEQMETELAGVFAVGPWDVTVRINGNEIGARIDGDESRPFTFAQMAQLPAIFGTEHINFGGAHGASHGSSWTGQYGEWEALIITATLVAPPLPEAPPAAPPAAPTEPVTVIEATCKCGTLMQFAVAPFEGLHVGPCPDCKRAMTLRELPRRPA